MMGSTSGKNGNVSDALPVYRADIDGLRAVAVLLVVADHLETHVSGGFIGVDVFFVISGYLISSAILRELSDGTFSIGSFYERRVRRIFPALIAVLLFSCIWSYRLLFPSELIDFAHSLLGAMFSVSNIVFLHESGYFSAPSAFKPLLHTWSLAVEEQFYIFFPLVLVIIRRFARKQLRLCIYILAVASFALAVLYVRKDATEAFFLFPLRAWELLVGTIVSQKYLPGIQRPWARDLATAGGLLMILIASIRYTSLTPFPGVAAIPACAGAALIIAGGEYGTSIVGRLLSLKPVVFIGLISYSLYLWHWPLIVFHNYGGLLNGYSDFEARKVKAALTIISLCAATLSWRFIETPFRKGRLRPGRARLFLITGLGSTVVIAAGFGFLISKGAPHRFPQDALQVAKYLGASEDKPYRTGVCFVGEDVRQDFSHYNKATCLAQSATQKNVLLIGDSHAAQLWSGFTPELPEIHLLQATVASCFVVSPDATGDSICAQMNRFIYGDYLIHNHVDAVFLAERWSPGDVPIIDRVVSYMKEHGIKLYLIGPNPEYDEPFPRVLAVSLRNRDPGEVGIHRLALPAEIDRKLKDEARDTWHIPYLSYFDAICAPDCAIYGAPGVPLLRDKDHMTTEGVKLLARSLRKKQELDALIAPAGAPADGRR